MRIIADLHIHSRFSRATSSKLTPPYLDRWARIKGINLVGTGDCTHPLWLEELRDQLQEAEEGCYVLKESARKSFDQGPAFTEGLPNPACADMPRFILTGEISTIYSYNGKTRKVHHVVILPDFKAASLFQTKLEKVGNIRSDGRPILGIDSRDLLEILLEADNRSMLIPAHIWTPWFSALGEKSGFDSVDECYRDLAGYIHAVETGLSSNPPMNWAVASLDRFSIVSNSDAHSPEKLGREATVLEADFLSYPGLAGAFSSSGPGIISETLEFFPQEGKYHYDGHRACGIYLNPEESQAAEGQCPVCGKPLTQGVLRRVMELAQGTIDEFAPCPRDYSGTNRRPYRSLIPLPELLGELLQTGPSSKSVNRAYGVLVEKGGSEFSLLLDKSTKELERLDCPGVPGELLAQAVEHMREGKVFITPGYDGEYGIIRAFAPGNIPGPKKSPGLFGDIPENSSDEPVPGNIKNPKSAGKSRVTQKKSRKASPGKQKSFVLDEDQQRAVDHPGGPALILAGPGTGKTAVLTSRIARLVENGTAPETILALTFSVKAAEELRIRLEKILGSEKAKAITAGTFHSVCRKILLEQGPAAGLQENFIILDDEERRTIIRDVAGYNKKEPGKSPVTEKNLEAYIEARKRFLLLPGDEHPRLGTSDLSRVLISLAEDSGKPPFNAEADTLYREYRSRLRSLHALDFDDLPAGTVRLLATKPETAAAYMDRFRHIFVDEYQDVNFAQYALIRLLTPPGSPGELYVIGDPNQAIYGFRGSDKRYIDWFIRDYPKAEVYRLSRSFRCAGPIIGAASRLTGTELTGSEENRPVRIYRSAFPTDLSEAEGIARRISRLIGGTGFFAMDSGIVGTKRKGSEKSHTDEEGILKSLGECAVLVRTGAMADPIKKALADHGVPCRVIGDRPWWEDDPAGPVIRFLRRVFHNKAETQIFYSDPVMQNQVPEIIPADFSPAGSPPELIEKALEVLGLAALKNDEGFRRLKALASHFDDPAVFLDTLALGSPQDGMEIKTETVTVMTIHASKGLEFDHVFVAGLEEGILPFTLFDHDEERIDEERRLLYVAMTRAREGLYLSWAASRTFRGRKLNQPPSRFLKEIEDLIPETREEPRKPGSSQLSLF